ncbi:MAG TPA: hypothetical protein VK759_02805 [Rhizomicrobium sp.]|nr:hypothetical protein [Rhizomicrobium sp.]
MKILAVLGLAVTLAAPAFAQDNGDSIEVILKNEHKAPAHKPKEPAAPVDPITHPTAKVILGRWFIDSYTPIYMELRPDGKLVSGWLAGTHWKARAPVAYKFKDETHFNVVGTKCTYEIFKINDTELDMNCGPVPQVFLRAVPPSGATAVFDKPPIH